jgi:hypothetical protein
MAMTAYLRKKLGDHTIGKASFTSPAAVFLGLFKASPTDSGALTDEVTGGSYARVSITASLSVFDAVSGVASSTADITFAVPTADWGTITHVGIIDASTAGNVLLYEAIPSPRFVASGGRAVKFTTGQLNISLLT